MYKNNNTTQGGKYKTTMCKHYNTQKGCSYGEKCQFAHGDSDLRGFGQGNVRVYKRYKLKIHLYRTFLR